MENFDVSVLPNPVLLYDQDWKIFDMNPPACHALGYQSRDELKGKDIFSVFHPSELVQVSEIQKVIQQGENILTGKNLFHLHKSSRVVKFTSQFGKIPSHQTNLGYDLYIESAVISDTIDEGLSNNEFFPENFRMLDENMPGLEMFLIDQNLHIHFKLGVETFKQRWISNPQNEWNVLYYFPVKVISILKPLLKIAFDRTPVSREFSYQKKYFSIHLIPFVVDEKHLRCVIILQNITEIKQAEKKLQAAKEEAEAANMAKDDFVAKMSHEIRSPLNAINGFLEQLQQTRMNKKQTGYLNIISNATQHLLSIIEDVLILSKIEANQIDIEKVPFHIPNLFKTISNLLKMSYEKKGLGFHIHTDDELNKNFLGDQTKIRQVLINLCSNAIKFTHEGKITLKAELVKKNDGMHTISFQVTDTGIGIKNADIVRILQPFQQVDNRIHRNFTGCGLGLTISKDLIKSMGGQMKIYSSPGQGSSFVFALDLKQTTASTQNYDMENISKVFLNHVKVLFVDDDSVNRMLGKVILKKFKVKADFANNGKEALKIFKPGKYDLVFLDINMPGMNGMEVSEKIREKESGSSLKKTKIVAMTASSLKRQIREYLESGMDSVMIKPYNEETFYRKIVQLSTKDVNPEYELDVEPLKRQKNNAFNMDLLLEITQGDEEFTHSMLRSFVKNGEYLLGEIQSALKNEDYSSIGEAAHTLSPSMEQLGIADASSLLKKLEKNYLRTLSYKKDPDLVENTIREVEKGIDYIRDAADDMEKSIRK